MKQTPLLFILLFWASSLFSQSAPAPQAIIDIGFCAQQPVLQQATQNANWQQIHKQIEKGIYAHFQQNETSGHGPLVFDPDYVLPVVVHIIHDNGAENIPDAQVLQGIQDLNDAYANVGYYNPSTGVDTKVQFCLAQRDPDGNATTGINRVESVLTDMVLETDDITVKDLSRWNPLEYINIWLVREICSSGYGCGVAGYAYFPASHGMPEDGIMMEAEFFGSSQGSSGVQIHEMGHYLGLYHTFQGACVNNDCLNDGDRVCDTPPDQSTAPVPCNGSANSCNTDSNSGFPSDQDDLFEDYMDYGDFNCWSVFTQGQADRMHWHIENVRFSLLGSPGCQDPCLSAIASSFNSSVTTLDVGGTVNFDNTSANASAYGWEVDGISFANTQDASYTFNTVGTFEVCLNVGNADPNCTDESCQFITVTCPVQPEFTTDVYYPNPGELVNYTNSSSNASGYTWTVNGAPVATTANLQYSFDFQGIYEVCLIADNTLCEAEFCLPVFVTQGSISDCEEAPFVRTFGEVGVDEEGILIIPSGDGNLYLGAREGSKTLIAKINIDGEPIWQRSFQFSIYNDVLSELIVDSDGNVVGCGYGENSSGNLQPFVFKYDPIANNVIWSHTYSAESRCFNLIEPAAGSDYILSMDRRESPPPGAFEDGILREISRNTGLDTGNLASNYNIGSSETLSATILHQNFLYSSGRYTNGAGTTNMRHSITKFDLSGNEIWTRLSHISTVGASARLYGRDILVDNNELITIASGDDDGPSATITNFFLQKNDLNGNIIWTRKYEIGAFSNEWAEEVISVSDGYIILGLERAIPGQLFVVKTDKDGNPLWAKSYGNAGDDGIRFTSQSQLISIGGYLYFTGYSSDAANTRDILLIKADSDGSLIDNCILVEDLKINMTNVNNPANNVFSLTKYPNAQVLTSTTVNPESSTLPYEDQAGCFCESVIECDTTFLKSYGTEADDEVSHAIAVVPPALGGGFLLGGGKADSAMITWVDQIGDIIWTRSFDATFDAADFIWDISFDSDNNVIGVGQTKDEPFDNVECLAFKYNMVTNTMLWINELDLFDPAQEQYYSIQEKSPGGNYIVAGKIDQLGSSATGCDGVIVELNRNTGSNVWQHNYSLGDCETFRRMIVHNSNIYATGGYNFDNSGTNRIRPGITKFDLNGNQIWSKLYLEPVSSADNARLYSMDLIEDNGLVIFGHGDDAGSSTIDNVLFLYKTDLSGNLIWSRKFELPGSTEEQAARILNLPDGYILLGFHTIGSLDAFVIKTDKQGNILWAKTYGDTTGDEVAWDMVWESGQIYFTGSTNSLGSGLSDDIYLVNLNADGTTNAQDSCNLFSDLVITEANWPTPYEGTHPLTDLGVTWGFFLDVAIMGETSVQSTVSCFNPCVDTCDLVPEALLVNSNAVCDLEGLALDLEICNDGNFELPAGTPVTIYSGDPTSGPVSVVLTEFSPEGIGHNECKTFSFVIAADPNTTYYVVVNDDGTTPTPFDLSAFDAPENECDYTNNIGSFSVDYNMPDLDLGPDIFVCEFGVVELDAGPDFVSYHWNDGSNMQTLTAWLPGNYWVEATDLCGFVQFDTISIQVDSAGMLDLGPDLMLCEGGSYSFDVSGFETYEWIPADYLDCPTCPDATSTPEEDISYILTATTADGCISIDTISINLIPGFMTEESIDICQGQSIDIFGEEVSEAGIYSETFSAQNGCDSTHTITLAVLDNFATEESIDICDGQSIQVFDEEVSEAGDYAQTFTAENGCDSTHTIHVGILDNFFTEEDLFICFDESVDIFGTPTNTAGVYEMTFTAANGCDSTHTITLEVNPEILIDFMVTNLACFEGMDGMVSASASGGSGDFEYVWGDGTVGPDITGLAAGFYAVTVTDGNACTAFDTVLVQQPTPVELTLIGTDITCDELGSAIAQASGGTGTYEYEWNNMASGPEISGLEAGTYSVTATDENGCSVINSVEITGALVQEVSISILQTPTEANPTSGALQVNISGGTGPFNILWNNGEPTNIIDSLGSGQYIVIVTDANGCVATDTAVLFLGGCIGGEVWNDISRDGCEDGGEFGISGVELSLSGIDIWGNPYADTTTTAFDGTYSFNGLPPGDYQVSIVVPTGYLLSPLDACSNDYSDSDFDANNLSYVIALEEGDCVLTVDAGLYDDCINVTNPGEICCDQVLCGPGNDAAPIQSVSPATGASPVEYVWMYSFVGGGSGNGSWMSIPNSNTLSYDPGVLYLTTYFVRCVRAIGCDTWLEGDYVTITVEAGINPEIILPTENICVGVAVTFGATPIAGATYSWQFGGTANPATANTQEVDVTWAQAAYPTVTLTVVTDACTTTESVQIAVSNDPDYCGANHNSEEPEAINWRTESAVNNGAFMLYPNPTSGTVFVRWESDPGTNVVVNLYAIDGKMLHASQVDGAIGQFETDLSHLAPGMYMIRVQNGKDAVAVFRVVKE